MEQHDFAAQLAPGHNSTVEQRKRELERLADGLERCDTPLDRGVVRVEIAESRYRDLRRGVERIGDHGVTRRVRGAMWTDARDEGFEAAFTPRQTRGQVRTHAA